MEVMGQGHSLEETWTWPPPDREENGAMCPAAAFPFSFPSLCQGTEVQGDGAGLWMSIEASHLEVTSAASTCGQ